MCTPGPSRRVASGAAGACAVHAEAQVLEEPRQHREGGEAHRDVDHVGGRAGPEDLLHDVRAEEADDPPVEGADDEKREPERLRSLDEVHRFLLWSDGLCVSPRDTPEGCRGYGGASPAGALAASTQSARSRGPEPPVHA